jgi:hypothetical protein
LAGLLFTTLGGTLSAGPPAGDPTLAQFVRKMANPVQSKINKIYVLAFIKDDKLFDYKLITFMITEYCKLQQK